MRRASRSGTSDIERRPRPSPSQTLLEAGAAFDKGLTLRRSMSPTRRAVLAAVISVACLIWMIFGYEEYTTYRVNKDVDHFIFDGAANLTEIALGSAYSGSWVAHPHLVAIGVLTGNDKLSATMREVQHETWMTYPDVARKANDFKGLVLPLYVAGLKYKWPPYTDPELQRRADADGDILFMKVVEQISTTGKGVGERRSSGTDYGSPSMVTNARKVSVWFRYAYQHFRYTPFLAKADLDTYINIPGYLAVVQQLPRVSTKFGRTRPRGRCIVEKGECFSYILGPLYTNTRDIAREVFTEPALMKTFSEPYTRCKLSYYRSMSFLNEDIVHSRTLHRRYADGHATRAFPTQELADVETGALQLPPVSGMGKLYMDYLTNRSTSLPLSGVVEGLEGYTYTYNLPETPKRAHIVYVVDNCRFPDYENATRHGMYHLILHHTYSAKIALDEHRRHQNGDTYRKLAHPSSLNFTAHRSFFYQVELSSIEC